jgi:hypothetical protein
MSITSPEKLNWARFWAVAAIMLATWLTGHLLGVPVEMHPALILLGFFIAGIGYASWDFYRDRKLGRSAPHYEA